MDTPAEYAGGSAQPARAGSSFEAAAAVAAARAGTGLPFSQRHAD